MKTKQLIITILMITFVTMITTKVEATENENKSGTLYDFDKEVENNSGIYDFDKEVAEEPKSFGALELIKQMSKYVDEEKEKLRRKEG